MPATGFPRIVAIGIIPIGCLLSIIYCIKNFKNIINEIIYNLDSTIVWISHDIQSIKNCDVIYELKQGTSKEVSISAK